MKSQRNWKLQQLGIIQWDLKPLVIPQRGTFFSIPVYVRLLIVTKKKISLNVSIIKDVLRALHIELNQVLQITLDQLTTLPTNGGCFDSWRIGVTEEIKLNGIHIISPELEKLTVSATAKRMLWKQICNYEHGSL